MGKHMGEQRQQQGAEQQQQQQQQQGHHDLALVGYSRFIRTNPRSDRFPVQSFHHVELYTSDATTAASRFSFSLGLPIVSRSPSNSSFLLRSASGSLSFLFSSPYDASPSPIPSFDPSAARSFVSSHGLAVRAVALSVADASLAFQVSTAHGALPSFPPTHLGRGFTLSEISLYGDVVLRFISADPTHPDFDPSIRFLPGFEDLDQANCNNQQVLDYGLRALDHAVGNVEKIAPVVSYIKHFLGFHEFAEFTAEDVGTAESGLNSVVLANNEENVLLPLNEPVHGTKRRSQIQTYLDHNGGPGVQHLALRSDDVIATMKKMKRLEGMGGFEFMPGPPPKYYEGVRRRAGDVLSEEQIRDCQDLGLLVDRDDQGVLLQIFTKPIGDR